MRLPDSAHSSRPWRIHEIAGDFRLEDVWALPTPGGRDDFPLLVEGFATADPTQESGGIAHALWVVRWKLGEIFGWDEPKDGAGKRVPTLRDRLPEDLNETGPEFDSLPFDPLYMTENEWAAEVANKTVHGVLHLGWVPDESGGWHGQMAVLVKPNGLFGEAYMLAIKPFRHLIVYPALMRRLGRDWQRRLAEAREAAAVAA
jgi:uncharacterized protein DUF2867